MGKFVTKNSDKALKWGSEKLDDTVKWLTKTRKNIIKGGKESLQQLSKQSKKTVNAISDFLKKGKNKVGTFLGNTKKSAGEFLDNTKKSTKELLDKFLGKKVKKETLEEATQKGLKEGAEKGSKETGEKVVKENADDLAIKKKDQLPQAIAEAKVITEINDAISTPVPLLIKLLNASLKPRYSWIKYLPNVDNAVLEKTALLKGTKIDRGGGTFWSIHKFDDFVGYDNGKKTKWIRAEYSSGTYHGHPMSVERVQKYIKNAQD